MTSRSLTQSRRSQGKAIRTNWLNAVMCCVILLTDPGQRSKSSVSQPLYQTTTWRWWTLLQNQMKYQITRTHLYTQHQWVTSWLPAILRFSTLCRCRESRCSTTQIKISFKKILTQGARETTLITMLNPLRRAKHPFSSAWSARLFVSLTRTSLHNKVSQARCEQIRATCKPTSPMRLLTCLRTSRVFRTSSWTRRPQARRLPMKFMIALFMIVQAVQNSILGVIKAVMAERAEIYL